MMKRQILTKVMFLALLMMALAQNQDASLYFCPLDSTPQTTHYSVAGQFFDPTNAQNLQQATQVQYPSQTVIGSLDTFVIYWTATNTSVSANVMINTGEIYSVTHSNASGTTLEWIDAFQNVALLRQIATDTSISYILLSVDPTSLTTLTFLITNITADYFINQTGDAVPFVDWTPLSILNQAKDGQYAVLAKTTDKIGIFSVAEFIITFNITMLAEDPTEDKYISSGFYSLWDETSSTLMMVDTSDGNIKTLDYDLNPDMTMTGTVSFSYIPLRAGYFFLFNTNGTSCAGFLASSDNYLELSAPPYASRAVTASFLSSSVRAQKVFTDNYYFAFIVTDLNIFANVVYDRDSTNSQINYFPSTTKFFTQRLSDSNQSFEEVQPDFQSALSITVSNYDFYILNQTSIIGYYVDAEQPFQKFTSITIPEDVLATMANQSGQFEITISCECIIAQIKKFMCFSLNFKCIVTVENEDISCGSYNPSPIDPSQTQYLTCLQDNSTNYILNGNFSHSIWSNPQILFNWSTDHGLELGSGDIYNPAFKHSDIIAELDAKENTCMIQSVTLPEGKYHLLFDTAARPGYPWISMSFDIKWNDQIIKQFFPLDTRVHHEVVTLDVLTATTGNIEFCGTGRSEGAGSVILNINMFRCAI